MLFILSFFIVSSMQCMESPITEIPNKHLTIEYAAALWQNNAHRSYQEDTITYNQLQKGHFFGVYDGHGSDRSDNNVSSFLQENLHKLFEQSEKETIKEKLEDAFYQAEIHTLKNFSDGSTAVVAYIDEKQVLHLAWVGDSRAVLEKQETIAYATTDHDPLHNKPELERIKKHGLFIENDYICNKTNNNPLAISRSIGDKSCKEVTTKKPLGSGGIIAIPEYYAIQLTPENNFLIMATDGLWLDVESIEAIQFIPAFQTALESPMGFLPTNIFKSPTSQPFMSKYQNPDLRITSDHCDESIGFAIRELGIGALTRGSEDNIGILIAQFKWPEIQK